MSYDLLRRAIADKRQVRFLFQGYVREVCPHVIGLSGISATETHWVT